MENLLLSAAIGDIAGSAYESRHFGTKDYGKVEIFSPYSRFTDDTVLTFACAEALINDLDMTETMRKRGNMHFNAGFGHGFKRWLLTDNPQPYNSWGDGSAMRCSSAGWLAKTEEECIVLATKTAEPTHNHPYGIKGAVATALTIFWLKEGKDKEYIRKNILAKYYPDWAEKKYPDIHDNYFWSSRCENVVPAAVISFLDSKDYVDCLKLAISLGGDADTLAAIAGPMAYAYYKSMPEDIVKKALRMLPDWMLKVNKEFDQFIETGKL